MLENAPLFVAGHNAVEDQSFVAICALLRYAALVRDDDAAIAEPFPEDLSVH